MSRRHSAKKREVIPDPKFGSRIVSKFINAIMLNGKKPIAEQAVYKALETVVTTLGIDAVEAIEKAIENVRPLVEVRSRRVGGASYQVPCNVRPERSLSLALRWLRDAALSRKDKNTLAEKLAAEILDAIKEMGNAVKKRVDTHKMAEANKAFAHFNW
jgi:small subunit ribosomal protein S7